MQPSTEIPQSQPNIPPLSGSVPESNNNNYKPQLRFDKQKIFLIGAVALIGLILIILIIVLIAGGGNNANKYLGKVIARDEEILRILDEYGKEARTKDLSVQIASSRLVLASDAGLLKEAGFSASTSHIEQITISNIDQQITDSIAQGSFDDFMQDYLSTALEHNIADIDLAIPEVKNDSTIELLEMVRQNYQDLK